MNTRHAQRAWIAAIVLIIVVAAGLRFWNIGGESLWFDEGYSAWVSSLPAWRIVEVIRHDVSPPLYYLMLAGWRSIFGETEAGLRSMSAAAGCMALLLMAMTAWRIRRDWLGVCVATGLFGVSVLQVQYAQEARSYGLASMLALAGLYGMVRRVQGRALWLALATGAMVGAVWLHNMMWFYVAAMNLAYLVMPGRPKPGRRIAELAVMNAVIVAAYLPWVPALRGQMQWLDGNFWAYVPGWGDLTQVLLAAGGTKQMHLSAALSGWGAAGVFAAAAGATVVLAMTGKEDRRWTAAMLLIGITPILAVFAYAHLKQSFFLEKVFTASTITLPLVAGIAAARWRVLGMAAAGLIAAASLLAAYGYFRWEQKEDWRGAMAYVNTAPREATLVVFVANEGELLYDYYTHLAGSFAMKVTGTPQGFFDKEPQKTIQRVLEDNDTARLAAMIDGDSGGDRRPDRVVLVLSHTHFSDPEMRTQKLVASKMRRMREAKFNLIDVAIYER